MSKVPQVLLIDPDRESAADLQRILGTVGYSVVGQAGYGVEGFTLAFQLRPDVVLARVDEPAARPVQTLSKLSDSLPDLPLVVFSGSPSVKLLRQCMMAGVSDFLSEPLQAPELEDALGRAIERRERAVARREGRLAPPVPQGTIITIFGAKGGIGKTTIASNLAIALSMEAKQTVALVDMDTRFGDVALTMDIQVERSIADLARNLDHIDRKSLGEFLVTHESGVRILPAPTRPGDWRTLTTESVRDVIDVLAQTHDFVILDTPGTFNELVAAAIELGTIILLVTTLDMASIKDTVLALEMLRDRFGNDSERLKVVLNRAGIDTGVRESDVEETLDSPFWWRIPHDNEVMRSAQIGRPIVLNRPTSKVSGEVRDMARSLSGVLPVQKTKSKGGSILFWPRFRKSA